MAADWNGKPIEGGEKLGTIPVAPQSGWNGQVVQKSDNASAVEKATSLPGADAGAATTPSAAGGATAVPNSSTQGGQDAMRKQQETAIEKAMQTIASLARGVKQGGIANALKQMMQPSQPTTAQPQSPSAQVSPQTKPADAQPKAVGGQAAQAAGITMRNVRGVETPEYLRGATAVQVPSWIDVNDDNAVRGFVDESNEVVGWMDGGNDEEEV